MALPNLDARIGDIEANATSILEAVHAAEGCDVLLTPELALCGYPPRDLLLREGLVDRCVETLEAMVRDFPAEMLVIVGTPWPGNQAGARCTNSLVACRGGRIESWAHKRLLPGYDVFDDDRYFHPGSEHRWIDHAGHRIGMLVCEDLWQAGDVREQTEYTADPVVELVEAGCDVLVAASASPFVTGKHARQINTVTTLARQHEVAIVSLNRAGSEDDLAFDGSALVADAGGAIRCHRQFPGPDERMQVVDLAERAQPIQVPVLDDHEARFRALVTCVRGYVHKTGHDRAIVGLSGGIDSAVTAAIAAAALGGSQVTGVMMPSRHSSDHSLADARALAQSLGLAQCLEIPIEPIHAATRGTLEALGETEALSEGSLADQNIQARSRGLILMAISNAVGGLVLSTGNKSELAAGYATLYGDMCGALAVLGDVLKMDVYGLAHWMNANPAAGGFAMPPIPASTITKPPSAELRPDQLDQDSLPPYEVLDEIVRRWVEEEQSGQRIIAETGADAELVTGVLRMIDVAQFKRDQAPVIPKVSRRAFGRGRPWPVMGRPGAAPVWVPATTEA
ncbi:MAG: NAD+ synthase [Phycisphaerales bacterium]|nr:NAD+ synthase [Phycisphaerales bacterium]